MHQLAKCSQLLKSKLFKSGKISVQDPSAGLVVHLIDPQDTDEIADVCAAPGGKTTYISEYINKGFINASDSDPVEAVLELSNGGVEFSFEALGRKETAEQCFEMLSPGGVATVIGMVPEGQKVEVLGSELLSEKTLQGSNMGSNQFRIDMPYYVDLYLEGKLKLDFIHEKNIELKDINESFQLLRDSDSGRHTVIFKS